jgi:hypothetical protein
MRNNILFTNRLSEMFEFPASGRLTEWDQVRPADDEPSISETQNILEWRTQLAIILTRPDPKEQPGEIGLLVEINQTTTPGRLHNQRTEGRSSGNLATERVAYCCQIIRRVYVRRCPSRTSRVMTDTYDGNGRPNSTSLLDLVPPILRPSEQNTGTGDEICIGEALHADQEWYVDGFQRDREHLIVKSRRAVRMTPRGRYRMDRYISGMASLLMKALPPSVFNDTETLRGLDEELPDMLKTFAPMIGDTDLSPQKLEIMSFVELFPCCTNASDCKFH